MTPQPGTGASRRSPSGARPGRRVVGVLVGVLAAAALLVRLAGCAEEGTSGDGAPDATSSDGGAGPRSTRGNGGAPPTNPEPTEDATAAAPAAPAAAGPPAARVPRARARPPAIDPVAPPRAGPARSTESDPAASRAAPGTETFGRLTVLGSTGATPYRTLGERVDADGDVAVASQWSRRDYTTTGGPFVYERRGGAWTFAQELAPPQYAVGTAWYVSVSGGRIVTVERFHPQGVYPIARAYRRGDDDAWTQECEIVTGASAEDWVSDWSFRDGRLVGAAWNALDFVSWRLEDGTWTPLPRSRVRGWSRSWLSLAGDTVAVESVHEKGSDDVLVHRLRGEAYRREAALTVGPHDRSTSSVAGALARGGAALVTVTDGGEVAIFERGALGWVEAVRDKLGAETSLTGRPVAADGDLAVIVARARVEKESRRFPRIHVLQRREDGWYRSHVDLPSYDDSGVEVTRGVSVAVSGRTVVVGTPWETRTGRSGGRVGFLEITDDDLAAATRIEPGSR